MSLVIERESNHDERELKVNSKLYPKGSKKGFEVNSLLEQTHYEVQ